MNNQELQEFVVRFNRQIDSNNKTPFSEDHYSAELRPYFEMALGLSAIFNKGDSLKKRPDITIFVSEEDSLLFRGAVGFVESKMPSEFSGLDTTELLKKFFEDKIAPYVGSWNTSLQFFILHCFNRFLLVKVDSELINQIQCVDPKSRAETDGVVAAILRSTTEVDLSNPAKIKSGFSRLTTWLAKHCSAVKLKSNVKSGYIGSVPVKTRMDIRAAATSLVDIILSEGGLFSAIEDRFHGDIEGGERVTRNSFKLFLSTRYPELKEDELEKKLELKADKSLFIVASVYNLISKMFLIRFVDEAYSSKTFPLYPREFRFFDRNIFEEDEARVAQLYILGLRRLSKNAHSLYAQILARDSLFDWILEENLLGCASFKSIFIEFQRLKFSNDEGALYTEEDFLGSFFEAFAQKFNAESRREYGQYYTPKPIVGFIWDRVLEVLRKENISLDEVKLLDPACGTGTFLTTGLNKLLPEVGIGLQEKLIAFDISPLAVRLTQINLFLEFLRSLNESDRPNLKTLEVHNTDALEISESEYWQKRLMIEESSESRRHLKQETDLNKRHKGNKEYTLIVTNPPYNGASSRTLESLKGRFTLLDDLLEKRHKNDRIRDDYVWFFGAIDRYINDNGVVGLITSDTYLNKASYRNLRAYLYSNYRIHSIYQLGQNMFDDVKVATSIIIMSKLKDDSALSKTGYDIEYFDLRDLKDNKADRTKDERYQVLTYHRAVPPKFIRPSLKNHFSFSSGTVLKGVVPFFSNKANLRIVNKKQSGIITGLNDFFVAKDVLTLKTRISFLRQLTTKAKSCVDAGYFKALGTTNDDIRKLAFELVESAKFKKYHADLESSALSMKLLKAKESEKSKAQTLLYLSMLVASCILKKFVPNDESILPIISADKKIDKENRWGLRPGQLDQIIFDPRFVIPRVSQNGSKVSGGPRTYWGEAHQPKVKIIFTTPSGADGVPRLLVFDKSSKPLMLKTVAEGEAEGHFCSLDDIVIPGSLSKVFERKLDAVFYIMGVYNSAWCLANSELIMNLGVPIPIPTAENRERILEISRVVRAIHENYAKIGSAESPTEWARLSELFKNRDLAFIGEEPTDSAGLLKNAEMKVDSLVESLFAECIEGQEGVDAEKVDSQQAVAFTDVLRRRLVISSYIVDSMNNDSRLGRVKFQKIFYLINSVLDIDLRTSFQKQAAGPLDSDLLYDSRIGIERMGKRHDVIHVTNEIVDGRKLVRYSAGPNIAKYSASFSKYLEKHPEQQTFVRKVIREFRNISGTKAEVIATLYAIMVEANEKSTRMTDADLLESFYKWHPRKSEKFDDRNYVQRILKWMRENSMTPPKGAKSHLK